MKSRLALLCAVVVGIALVAGCAPSTTTLYDVAKNQMDDQKYADSNASFAKFITENPNSDLVPYAMYRMAENYRAMYNKDKAMAAYKDLITKYPTSKPAAWAAPEMAELDKMPLVAPVTTTTMKKMPPSTTTTTKKPATTTTMKATTTTTKKPAATTTTTMKVAPK